VLTQAEVVGWADAWLGAGGRDCYDHALAQAMCRAMRLIIIAIK
jgi:hypothetical protein